jgi:hypothetical protein
MKDKKKIYGKTALRYRKAGKKGQGKLPDEHAGRYVQVAGDVTS